jgi:hypothetical protein
MKKEQNITRGHFRAPVHLARAAWPRNSRDRSIDKDRVDRAAGQVSIYHDYFRAAIGVLRADMGDDLVDAPGLAQDRQYY